MAVTENQSNVSPRVRVRTRERERLGPTSLRQNQEKNEVRHENQGKIGTRLAANKCARHFERVFVKAKERLRP